MSDDEIRQWADRLVPPGSIPTPEHDNVVALLRDATLFDFDSVDDIKLFMQLVQRGLQMHVCVCLNGTEYIDNNVSALLAD